MSEVPHVFIDSGDQSFVCPVCGGYWLGIGHIGCIEKLQSSHDTLQSKLTEVEVVLAWASENVWLQRWPERSQQERWTAYPLGISKWHNAPTLYEALKSAWEARDK